MQLPPFIEGLLVEAPQPYEQRRFDLVLRPLLGCREVVRIDDPEYDYVSNTLECTSPDGLDTEVMSLDTLAQACREAKLKSEREHVTPYIINRPDRFRLGSVRHHEDLSSMRWTVDQPEDLEFVRRVYRELNGPHCGQRDFGMSDVLQLLRNQPELIEINQGIKRNEGYARSKIENGIFLNLECP